MAADITLNPFTGRLSGQDMAPAIKTPPKSTDKNMFMQLLVAQMRNQDPMSPSDGTQFIAQLAQFQQLEQSVNTGQDITAIRQDLDQLAGKTSGTSGQ
jgi:flagellar basal-body rod modification protein FlgD